MAEFGRAAETPRDWGGIGGAERSAFACFSVTGTETCGIVLSGMREPWLVKRRVTMPNRCDHVARCHIFSYFVM